MIYFEESRQLGAEKSGNVCPQCVGDILKFYHVLSSVYYTFHGIEFNYNFGIVNCESEILTGFNINGFGGISKEKANRYAQQKYQRDHSEDGDHAYYHSSGIG